DGDVKGALAICESVAKGYASSVPAIAKLAVLQEAWFLERTGDLQRARSVLHEMGSVRGFELDLDRLSFMARICHQLGTPESIHQPLHVYESLTLHYGKLSALPALAALHRTRGEQQQADAYAAQFERRFLKRMQRLAPAERVYAASLYY